jgi:hypothetical protein
METPDRRIDDAEIRRIEARWKSDVDLKLDKMLARSEKYDQFLDMLMRRESSREALRQVMIQKGVGATVWAIVLGACTLLWAGIMHEAKK